MSMMREMTFFLGLQVNQSPCGIFINQSKYVLEILNKYGMESCDPVGTLMEIKDKLDLDQNRTHAKTTEKHLKEVKRILRYLWGTVNTGLWYTKDSGFELTVFLDADYAGCKDTFKSTFGGAQFLGEKLTEMELELEQTQQGSSHEVSISNEGVKELKRIEVLLNLDLPGHRYSIHTVKQSSRNQRIRRWRYNLTLAESKFKTPMLDHQDKYMMKAQVHVLNSSAISEIQPLPGRKHYYQIYQVVKHMLRGRLLASFQDHEHEGGDTRLHGGIKENDLKIKIQDHNMHMFY
nr:hypothetical protein [Tanacetum cinerariifolium]